MARIADKHGLTNGYRSVGTGKRVVKRGRPKKYLFGPPSRKTHKRSNFKIPNYNETYNYDPNEFEDDARKCLSVVLISFLSILIILFSIIPVFRCMIPIIIGSALLCTVDGVCKKAWGLPSGKWSKPLSIGWTLLTSFAMVIGFFLVLFIQIAGTSFFVLLAFILIYAGLSTLILRGKYNKVKKSKVSTKT